VRTSLTAFLVPLKTFDAAKERLGEELDNEDRAELMQALAAGVLTAAEEYRRWVVCDNRWVAQFALMHGAEVIWRGGGLNNAVQMAAEQLAREGFSRVIACHGDLATPGSFRDFDATDDRLVIAGDRAGDGSNVVSVPTDVGFTFAYGPGSLHRHLEEARRCGLDVSTVDTHQLDVDTPEDLELYRSKLKLTVAR
jgi:2-phospho-L-lactate guanylyltransferase